MNIKEHPIQILEEALKYEEERLGSCQQTIKSMRSRITKDEDLAMKTIARISGLQDALHKLKGLDNLEKGNELEIKEAERRKLEWKKFCSHYEQAGRQFYSEWLQRGEEIKEHKVYEFVGKIYKV